MEAARTIGVVGAGTMGAGIAQLAAQAGLEVVLHDPVAEALERGLRRAREHGAPADRLTGAGELSGLAACELVVEAAPESLELKGELLRDLSRVTGGVLASNTSSLSVTALGAASGVPERVVGMHFFNPPPVMRLIEVVAGLDTAPESVARARATAEAMDRRVVEVADGVGFLVNRCNRPFALEGMRLVAEGIATPQQVDRICRLGGGFRMGPFELMDLVGMDVGLEVSRSFFEQGFGEPRWRPSPLQARMVAAGRLGRKSGRGWYAYPDGRPEPRPEEQAPAAGGGAGLLVVAGELPVADALRGLAVDAGWEVATPEDAAGRVPVLAVDAGGDGAAPQGGPRLLLCADETLSAQELGGPAVGFSAVDPRPGGLVELTRRPGSSAHAAQTAERVMGTLGVHVAWVGDGPGLVLARILACLVNETAFAIGEGVADPADVDDAMMLGLNHPRGPLAWARAMGVEHVVRVLDGLAAHTGTDRYGVAPVLARMLHEDAPPS